eukprot:scaffold1697_cov120-Cylindrotheca_fusiformis.AAC.2
MLKEKAFEGCVTKVWCSYLSLGCWCTVAGHSNRISCGIMVRIDSQDLEESYYFCSSFLLDLYGFPRTSVENLYAANFPFNETVGSCAWATVLST